MDLPHPQQRYLTLATKLRHRIEFAEFIMESNAPVSQKVETVSLQGRMAVETIAFMSLVATENSLGHLGLPRDAKTHWNAEKIFRRLKSKNLNILPSPSRMHDSHDPRFKAIFEGVPENNLSYDDLIGIYRVFHEGLHAPNPYVQPDDGVFYSKLIEKLRSTLRQIRKFVWVHFISIKGIGFAVDLRNSQNKTVVVPLSKSAELPDDFT